MPARNEPGSTTLATPSDREVVITRVVDAPRRLVFDAWTKPEHVPHWLTGPEGWTMPFCEIDLRVGGKWRFLLRGPDGAEMQLTGVYKEVTPPSKLVATSSWGAPWPHTLDTLTLSEDNGKTTITQTILYPSKAARDAALETGMKEGMAIGLDRLERYLRTTG